MYKLCDLIYLRFPNVLSLIEIYMVFWGGKNKVGKGGRKLECWMFWNFRAPNLYPPSTHCVPIKFSMGFQLFP